MWGIFPRREAEHIIPQGHRHPHFKRASSVQPAARQAQGSGFAAV